MNKITREKGVVILTITNDNVSQVIRVPYTKYPYHVDAFLMVFGFLYNDHRRMARTKAKCESYKLPPILDWRKDVNDHMNKLREYAFDAIQDCGADERMITTLMDSANHMYMEVHSFYQSYV